MRFTTSVLLCAMLSMNTLVSAADFFATFQGTGSGTIGQATFNTAQFTITAIGRTANRRTISSSILDIPSDQATIDIVGIGQATFLLPTRVFHNRFGGILGGAIGFSRDLGGNLDILNVVDPVLQDWDMTTNIGPVFESSPGATQATMLSTSQGQLDFTSISSVTLTVVPEPSGFLIPLVLLAWLRRRNSSDE